MPKTLYEALKSTYSFIYANDEFADWLAIYEMGSTYGMDDGDADIYQSNQRRIQEDFQAQFGDDNVFEYEGYLIGNPEIEDMKLAIEDLESKLDDYFLYDEDDHSQLQSEHAQEQGLSYDCYTDNHRQCEYQPLNTSFDIEDLDEDTDNYCKCWCHGDDEKEWYHLKDKENHKEHCLEAHYQPYSLTELLETHPDYIRCDYCDGFCDPNDPIDSYKE